MGTNSVVEWRSYICAFWFEFSD